MSLHHDVSEATGDEVALFTLASTPYRRQAVKKQPHPVFRGRTLYNYGDSEIGPKADGRSSSYPRTKRRLA